MVWDPYVGAVRVLVRRSGTESIRPGLLSPPQRANVGVRVNQVAGNGI